MTRVSKISALFAAIIAAALCGCASEEPAAPSADRCPSWVDDPQDHHSNQDSAWLGCANALNLRHMAEDPADLKEGRTLGPADGARQAAAVKAYQEDKVKSSAGTGSSQPAFIPLATGNSNSGGD